MPRSSASHDCGGVSGTVESATSPSSALIWGCSIPIEPSGIDPSGIEPSGIEPSGIEPSGAASTACLAASMKVSGGTSSSSTRAGATTVSEPGCGAIVTSAVTPPGSATTVPAESSDVFPSPSVAVAAMKSPSWTPVPSSETSNEPSPVPEVVTSIEPRKRPASSSSASASRENSSTMNPGSFTFGLLSTEPDTVNVEPLRLAWSTIGKLSRSLAPTSASSAAPPSFGVGPSPARSIAIPPFERNLFAVIVLRRAPGSTTTPEPVSGVSSTPV